MNDPPCLASPLLREGKAALRAKGFIMILKTVLTCKDSKFAACL